MGYKDSSKVNNVKCSRHYPKIDDKVTKGPEEVENNSNTNAQQVKWPLPLPEIGGKAGKPLVSEGIIIGRGRFDGNRWDRGWQREPWGRDRWDRDRWDRDRWDRDRDHRDRDRDRDRDRNQDNNQRNLYQELNYNDVNNNVNSYESKFGNNKMNLFTRHSINHI